MENNNAETYQHKYALLLSPKFSSGPVYKGHIIC